MPNDNDVVFKIEESIKDDIKYQDLVIKNKELFDIKRIQNSWYRNIYLLCSIFIILNIYRELKIFEIFSVDLNICLSAYSIFKVNIKRINVNKITNDKLIQK